METPYRAIRFQENDTITRNIMEQVASNLQWLGDNVPRGRLYRASGDDAATFSKERTIVVSGRVAIGKSKKEATVTRRVRFGKSFAPRCRPNVTTGVISAGAGDVYVVVNGPSNKVLPDATGCEIKVTAPDADGIIKKKKWEIVKPIIVCWQAFGFRAEGVNEF